METPASLLRAISPPPTLKSSKKAIERRSGSTDHSDRSNPTLAAIEAGRVKIKYHLEYSREHLASVRRNPEETSGAVPRLSIDAWTALYHRNQNKHGRHFVVHQHQHPVAGVHYDLRLQFSETSSISFAIPYGLPGNPNSTRPNRMAIETRVHCLWAHLIESASSKTGSLLIWDTGEYEVLPRVNNKATVETEDELSDSTETETIALETTPENQKLISAFQKRSIILRLHGTRLPKNYTISLRLLNQNDTTGTPNNRFLTTSATPRKRRRNHSLHHKLNTTSSDSEDAENSPATRQAPTPAANTALPDLDLGAASDASETEEDRAQIRALNAYPGATNSIGSVHQRRWLIGLDRPRSGFMRGEARRWVRRSEKDGDGFEAFVVWGSEGERSVVTGRLAAEVLADEGVEGFVERKMWRAIVE